MQNDRIIQTGEPAGNQFRRVCQSFDYRVIPLYREQPLLLVNHCGQPFLDSIEKAPVGWWDIGKWVVDFPHLDYLVRIVPESGFFVLHVSTQKRVRKIMAAEDYQTTPVLMTDTGFAFLFRQPALLPASMPHLPRGVRIGRPGDSVTIPGPNRMQKRIDWFVSPAEAPFATAPRLVQRWLTSVDTDTVERQYTEVDEFLASTYTFGVYRTTPVIAVAQRYFGRTDLGRVGRHRVRRFYEDLEKRGIMAFDRNDVTMFGGMGDEDIARLSHP